ncbi:cytochrome c [Kushneria pakistanensis]|uniref:Cytochrome c n=2 Tax=Kushneria pakistanensis TaxID=1508770 RepID=A0ABQ3FNQ0_9GAMM|nr:cytochrome c [Kushneria pakistanensis]
MAVLAGIGTLMMATTSSAADNDETIERGAYLARAGDCVACHTAPDGEDFAGGLGIESPFGTIYSTNITPDKKTGIGDWSEEEFAAALRDGKRADGANLYPAMPYPSYARVSDEDIHALYVYFMKGVEPVQHQPEETSLSFPFNQRWGISAWNWLFAGGEVFEPKADRSEQINRGAYLVEGLGHCGSCHTPRGIFQQEKALDDSGDDYLSGADLNDWLAPSLRGKGDGPHGMVTWSEDDIVEYLATGRNERNVVSGEMTDVIENSTSHMSEEDLRAIAVYLKSLPANESSNADVAQTGEEDNTRAHLDAAKDLSSAERLYLDNCSACHFNDGMGAPRVFPALDGNSLANADNPTGLIHTILAGAEMPSTEKMPSKLVMPGFAWRLSDEEVADLATFVRQGWSNQGGKVTADEVSRVRDELHERSFSTAPASVIDGEEFKKRSGDGNGTRPEHNQ